MTGQVTKPYRATLSGSVGAGMGSLFNPNGRKYYILEHRVSSKYHRAGEMQEIIIDQIELGRDPRCQVRFDDERFKTVSRRHAAIVKDGDGWKLIQISKTNSTLLNGRPIKTEWYLQSGDEIQLAVNGPKLGFIVPTGKKATVGSIGLTRRLSLFRQQALRPYKRAIAGLAAALVVTAGGLGGWNYYQHLTIEEQQVQLANQGKELANQIVANKENKAKADSLAEELVANNKKMADYEQTIANLKKNVASANARAAAAWKKAQQAVVSNGVSSEALKACADKTYFIAYTVTYNGKPAVPYCSTGTGVLLNDGRLVTCLHVCNPYHLTAGDSEGYQANALMNINPSAFHSYLLAISPTGDRIEIDEPINGGRIHYGSNSLTAIGTLSFEGKQLPVKDCSFASSRDYAWIKVGRSGGLAYDNALSTSMPINTKLNILGFPKGVGAEDMNHVSPIASESSVARAGLDTDGCILLSNSETDHGNSGGPVLTQKDGQPVVVGILSGANRLGSKTNPGKSDGKWKDRVVPIGNVR